MIDSIQMEDVPCPFGCPQNDEVVLTGHDLLHNLPGEFTVVKCRSCGLMRTNPRPTQETISFYYPDRYGSYLGTRVQQDLLPERLEAKCGQRERRNPGRRDRVCLR